LPEPEFESKNQTFSVLFRKTDLKTNEIENRILIVISEDYHVSIPEIAEKIGKWITSTKEYLNKLKKSGLLKRIGPPKSGHWQVLEN